MAKDQQENKPIFYGKNWLRLNNFTFQAYSDVLILRKELQVIHTKDWGSAIYPGVFAIVGLLMFSILGLILFAVLGVWLAHVSINRKRRKWWDGSELTSGDFEDHILLSIPLKQLGEKATYKGKAKIIFLVDGKKYKYKIPREDRDFVRKLFSKVQA